MNNRLTRSENDQWIAGVCGGLAQYINVDPVIVRGLFALLLFASGIGLPIYLILWFIMPSEDNQAQSGSEIIGSNFEDFGQTISKQVNSLGKPATVGTLLIMFGGFFLLRQIGILSWLGGGIFWPLVIIGLGVYFLVRRSSNDS